MTFKDYALSIVDSRPADGGDTPPLVVVRDALTESKRRYVESDEYGNGPYVTYVLGDGNVRTPLYGNTDEHRIRLDAYLWQPPDGNDVADRANVDAIFDLLAHAPQFVDEDEDGAVMTQNSFHRVALVRPRLSPQTGKTLIGTLRFAYGVRI